MKKIYTFIYAAILFAAPTILFAQNELSGQITDANTGKPLQGVDIYIPDFKVGTTSNENGNFSLKNISTQNFLIEVKLVGYKSQIENVSVKGKTKKNFALTTTTSELDEVIVTGVSSATEQRKNPSSSSVLTSKNLFENTSANVIDAIQNIPGVSQITAGPSLSKPIIRGLGYNRVVVVNDGVRQEGQQWGDEFGIEIDEYTVNRVEVIKGASSLSYGSDAMAGVINFLGSNLLPEGKIKGSVLANYQTNNGLYATSLNLAGNQKGFIWDVRYTNKMAHNYQNKYDGYVWNSAYGENNFKAIVGLNKSWGYSHLKLSLFDLKLGIIEGARDPITGEFATHFKDQTGEDSLGVAPSSDNKKYNNYPIIHQHVRHYKALLDNSFSVGSGRLAVKLGYQENYRQEANDITKGDVYNNYFFLKTINYDAQYILQKENNLSWSFGVNGMSQSSEDRGSVFLVPEYNLFDFGVFTTATKTFNKVTVSGGLRFDTRHLQTKNLYVDSITLNRLDAPTSNSFNRFTGFISNFSGMSGSIGVAYDFTKNIYGKLNISRGYRAPTIAESGSDGIHDGTPFYEIGDAHLKAETSLQFDATIGINNEDITAEITGFSNSINNYIFPTKLSSANGGDSLRVDFASGLPASPTFKYVAGDATLSGAEFVLNIHPKNIKWLSIENSFSFVSAIQKNQGDSTKYLPYTPPAKELSRLKFSCKKLNNMFQNIFLKIGVENYFEQNKIYYKFGDETVTPGYTLLNIGLGAEIFSNKNHICSIYIGCNNLTDVAYQSNMSRIKYGDVNNVTGRVGVYNMGRNFSFKLIVPVDIKK